MNDRLMRRFDRLEAVRKHIDARIDGIDAARLCRAPEPGRWSAVQVIGHLVKAETLSLSYIAKKASDPSKLQRAGFSHALKSMFVIAVMRVPLKFRAPEIVAEVPDNDDPTELRDRWRTLRGEMRTLLESIPDDLLSTCLYKHPVAGPMTLESAIDFMIAHGERHAGQIDRVLRAMGT